MTQTPKENQWQPVKIARAAYIAQFHEGSCSEFWNEHQGKIVYVRRSTTDRFYWDPSPPQIECLELFDIHPDYVLSDETDIPVRALCEHQILAD